MKGILGRKLGMTQLFEESGKVVPVTVVQAGPMVVTQIKTQEIDGYKAIQVGYVERKEKHANQPMKGHFAKANVELKRYLREFLVENPEEFELGQEIKVDVFEEKDVVDVVGTSKGKGTQGSIKRHNYGRGPMGHGSKSHRIAGARSAGSYPARVFKGRKGSGKMGHDRVTVQNLEVVRVDADKNLLLIKGAIPGPKGGLVTVKEAKKASK
ncbi:50S ribosomal protein L3 [Helcococcus sueciensis]|uniref:50S ribosomal protein L3 n=1 Tax=Helcococcus sueciensis TaxID=241555 RepID=UPI0004244A97|nr:50S ribosomal protein L3 [Helcococcus sueciensis]